VVGHFPLLRIEQRFRMLGAKGLSADLRQLWCDDGAEQNTYSVKNYMESTRYGLKGSAKIFRVLVCRLPH